MNNRNREPANKEIVFLATSSIRKSLGLVLITSILGASLIIIFSPSNKKDLSAVIIQTLASANAPPFRSSSFIGKKPTEWWVKHLLSLL